MNFIKHTFSSGYECEECCVTSQHTSDTFLSDSKRFVRANLDYYNLFIFISSQIIFMYILTNCSPTYSKCTGYVFKMHPLLYKFAYLFNFNMHARISPFPFWRWFNTKQYPPLLSDSFVHLSLVT